MDIQMEARGAKFGREPLNEGIRRLLHVAVKNVSILLGACLVPIHNSDGLFFDLCKRHVTFKWLVFSSQLLLAFFSDAHHVEDFTSADS